MASVDELLRIAEQAKNAVNPSADLVASEETSTGLQIPQRTRESSVDQFFNTGSFQVNPADVSNSDYFPGARPLQVGSSPGAYSGGSLPIFVGSGNLFPYAALDARQMALKAAATEKELQSEADLANALKLPDDPYEFQAQPYWDKYFSEFDKLTNKWKEITGSEAGAYRALNGGNALATQEFQRLNVRTNVMAKQTQTLAKKSADVLSAAQDPKKFVLPQAISTAQSFLKGETGAFDDKGVKDVLDANIVYGLNDNVNSLIDNINMTTTSYITNKLQEIKTRNPDLDGSSLYQMVLNETEKFIPEEEAGRLASAFVSQNALSAETIFGDVETATEKIKQIILDAKGKQVESKLQTIKNFAPKPAKDPYNIVSRNGVTVVNDKFVFSDAGVVQPPPEELGYSEEEVRQAYDKYIKENNIDRKNLTRKQFVDNNFPRSAEDVSLRRTDRPANVVLPFTYKGQIIKGTPEVLRRVSNGNYMIGVVTQENIDIPVLDANGKQVKENGVPKTKKETANKTVWVRADEADNGAKIQGEFGALSLDEMYRLGKQGISTTNQGGSSSNAPKVIAPGYRENGYEFKGGDSADPKNWKKI